MPFSYDYSADVYHCDQTIPGAVKGIEVKAAYLIRRNFPLFPFFGSHSCFLFVANDDRLLIVRGGLKPEIAEKFTPRMLHLARVASDQLFLRHFGFLHRFCLDYGDVTAKIYWLPEKNGERDYKDRLDTRQFVRVKQGRGVEGVQAKWFVQLLPLGAASDASSKTQKFYQSALSFMTRIAQQGIPYKPCPTKQFPGTNCNGIANQLIQDYFGTPDVLEGHKKTPRDYLTFSIGGRWTPSRYLSQRAERALQLVHK